MPRVFRTVPMSSIARPEGEVDRRLLNSIEQVGLLHPITVRQPDARTVRFEIVAGRRRFLAMEALNMAQIDVYVLDGVDVVDQGFITYTENDARSGNLISEILAIRSMALSGMTLDAIRQRFHLGGASFLNRARVAFLPNQSIRDFLLRKLENRTVTLATAAWIAHDLDARRRYNAVAYLRGLPDGRDATRRDIWAVVQRSIGQRDQLPLEGITNAHDVDEEEEDGVADERNQFTTTTYGIGADGFTVEATSLTLAPGSTTPNTPHSTDVPLPDFWWRQTPSDLNPVVFVNDVRGTRGWASVAALLEAAEAAIPQDGSVLADTIASKINGMMNQLTQHYRRNSEPPAIPAEALIASGRTAREGNQQAGLSVLVSE